MTSTARWAAISLGAVLALGACHHRANVGESAAAASWNGAITVKVVNHSWHDITVYFLQGTHRERIGTATATSTTQFEVPLRRFSGGEEYRLFADAIGSRQIVRSEPLHAQDGDLVTWTLEDDLSRSFVEVR